MTSTRYQRPLIALLLAGLLTACGGRDETASETSAKSISPTSTTASSASSASTGMDVKAQQEAAALNRAELARAAADEKRAVADSKTGSAQRSAGVDKFSAGTRVPVYRFYVPARGAHFYTASEAEKQTVQANLSASYLYEGIAFDVSRSAAIGLHPVFRYFNSARGTHFYTISAAEKAYVDANLPALHYEGIAFYASQTAGNGLQALTRFYQSRTDSHFYTRSATETQYVRDHLSSIYQEEGVAFYVIDPSYTDTARVPHSGVSDQQCYEAGSDTLVSCSDADATSLNSEQDGHRTEVNPMSYSEVPKPAGGTFARTECVKDDVTGLVWEGKTASGQRASSNTYTNYDDPAQPQKWDDGAGDYVHPTQGEIDAATNSLGYVAYVNSIALCGYTDWRRPTVDELHGLVDYGVDGGGPMLVADWFPNSAGHFAFLTTSPYAGVSAQDWKVDFSGGYVYSTDRDVAAALRLVRGSQ